MNGTVFEALRMAHGPRIVLAICITGEYEIRAGLKIFKLEKGSGRAPVNWSKSTLGQLVISSASGEGFCYEAEWNTSSKPATVLLVATEPSKINLLEKVFNL